MLGTTIQLSQKYNYLEEKFKIGYEFLHRADLANLELGAIPIKNGVIAFVQQYVTNLSGEAKFEAHDKFFDIQYVISGEEMFEVADRNLLQLDTPYDEVTDIAFYNEPANKSVVYLKAGDLIVVSPEEAHKPRCCISSGCEVKKIVVKVPV